VKPALTSSGDRLSIFALYEKGAEIREITREKLKETINRNFYNLFNHLNGLA